MNWGMSLTYNIQYLSLEGLHQGGNIPSAAYAARNHARPCKHTHE